MNRNEHAGNKKMQASTPDYSQQKGEKKSLYEASARTLAGLDADGWERLFNANKTNSSVHVFTICTLHSPVVHTIAVNFEFRPKGVCVCFTFNRYSTHLHPAQPVSVSMPRSSYVERRALWSQTTRQSYTLEIQQGDL